MQVLPHMHVCAQDKVQTAENEVLMWVFVYDLEISIKYNNCFDL